MNIHRTITVTRAAFASLIHTWQHALTLPRLATPALPTEVGADREQLFENGGGI